MKKISFFVVAIMAVFSATAQHRSTFDSLGLAPNSYWDGSNMSGGFLDGDAYFTNTYDTAYGGYWSGFAYSNIPVNVDTITSSSNDYSYQYQSAAGAGVDGSKAFGIAYLGDPVIRLKGFATGHAVYGMYVTNSAYDYISMKFGDGFAKKFGGVTGMDSDWFRLTITGWYQGAPIADSVQVYLADFRSPDSTQHYIQKDWKFVNLLSLGNVDSLSFILQSTDTAGGFGMNTPAYFNLDNFMTTDGASYRGPIAVNDSFGFYYMDSITNQPDTLHANILANDSLSSFFSYTVSLLSGPEVAGAFAYLDSNNNLVYIPAAGVQAEDTLTYSVCDDLGNCDTAVIVVFVQGYFYDGIHEIDAPDLHLYPNPAYSLVSISYSSAMESVSVMDMSGRELIQSPVNKNATTLDVSALSPGVYSIIIHTTNGIAVRQLVKE
jgi:hypothetical protein